MNRRHGAFHHKHGRNIRLSELNTVAVRFDSYDEGVVFSERPIPIGSMFQVKLLDTRGDWAGSIRFGFTVECPDGREVPSGALGLYRSPEYWILSADTVHNAGQEWKITFNLESLRVGQNIGCMVTKEGELAYFVDGWQKAIVRCAVPTDRPMWGFADIYGIAREVRCDFMIGAAASGAVGSSRENELKQQLDNTLAEIVRMRKDAQSKELLLQTTQQQLQEKDRSLQRSQQQVQELTSRLSRLSTEPWVISRKELTLTRQLLGSGAYGEVRVALFRGLRVAAKCLHNVIISDYNLRIFSREMSIASRLRHPNLLLFIGATTQGRPPIIVTELMATSLRAELSQHPLPNPRIKSIAMDVACGLNYLHQWKPHPIIHRDVSSPNVLLKPSGANSWEAKVSDYGSANFVQQISSYSVAPGNPAYAAPEARFPDDHTPKMDVYSFGVLLFEMSLQEQPELSVAGRAEQAKMVQWDPLAQIIEECIAHLPKDRPTIARVMEKLKQIPV